MTLSDLGRGVGTSRYTVVSKFIPTPIGEVLASADVGAYRGRPEVAAETNCPWVADRPGKGKSWQPNPAGEEVG